MMEFHDGLPKFRTSLFWLTTTLNFKAHCLPFLSLCLPLPLSLQTFVTNLFPPFSLSICFPLASPILAMLPPSPKPTHRAAQQDEADLDRHSQLVKTISDFDRSDIGSRLPDLPSDLQNIKSILITGGAGFMYAVMAHTTETH